MTDDIDEIEQLKAQNAALVKALEEIANTFDESWFAGSIERGVGDKARAALSSLRAEQR